MKTYCRDVDKAQAAMKVKVLTMNGGRSTSIRAGIRINIPMSKTPCDTHGLQITLFASFNISKIKTT